MTARLPKDAGLSLLEVLVAVSVLGLALAPLVVIQGQIAQTHRRYEAAYENSTLQRNALMLLQDLNPMAAPTGEMQLDPTYQVRWTSEARTRVDRSAGYPIGDGPFDIALYQVNAEIVDTNAAVRLRFTTERVGWQRIDAVQSQDPDRFGAPMAPDPSVAYIPPPTPRP